MGWLLRFKHWLRRRLSPAQWALAKRRVAPWLAPLVARDPRALAMLYGSDKWGHHWYAEHYARHFGPLRRKRLRILEIGVGGYDDPAAGGASLRLWKSYFPRSHIYGIDVFDKSAVRERRLTTFQGSQADADFLREVAGRIGRLDIVIDDGSHRNEHVLESFRVLFPLLAPGGLYVVEDTQTSYWRRMGGDSIERNSPKTSMGFLKSLADGLNHAEFEIDHEPSYTDVHVAALHFYHNLVFVEKS